MSIIYDALQKTQKKREVTVETAPTVIVQPKKLSLGKLPAILIAGMLAAGLLEGAYLLTKHYFFQPVKAPAAPQASLVSKFVLGGVFLSNNTKVVMINDKLFNLGDTIDGMRIVRIDSDAVELKNADNSIILK